MNFNLESEKASVTLEIVSIDFSTFLTMKKQAEDFNRQKIHNDFTINSQ